MGTLIDQIREKVPRTAWEGLSPIMYEAQLRQDEGPFLGSAVLFEQLMQTDGVKLIGSDGASLIGLSKPRSPEWEKFSKDFLYGKVCAACGGKFRLVAHHMTPFHKDPSRELDPTNLIPLCEGRYSCNCHLTFGHLGNWTLFNPKVIDMSAEYQLQWTLARKN